MSLDKHVLSSLLLLAVLAFAAWWHTRENNQLTQQWRKLFDAPTAQWLERFAWWRTSQLLCALVCCTLIIVVYDRQLNEAHNELAASEQARQQPAPAPAAAQPTPAPTPTPAPSYYPPVSAQPAATANATETIEDVYNPEKQGNDSQSSMDDIKKRYEDILVIYMFLKKCGKTDPADYRVIISALAQEMASVDAPGRLQYDIQTAAQGSYNEIYSQTDCDSTETAGLHGQYTDYIKTLSENFPAQ